MLFATHKIRYHGAWYTIKKGPFYLYIGGASRYSGLSLFIDKLFSPYDYMQMNSQSYGLYPGYFYETLIKCLFTENIEYFQSQMKRSFWLLIYDTIFLFFILIPFCFYKLVKEGIYSSRSLFQ